ncbi:3-hydroxyacyl-CoA dehydrogenase [Aquisalimonas lutea]|uniref:3-hydroxyacyl-CoA dehydrogenase n=1 Tax=Aquisalimonas lutea TaxID=1327750 RepID=UPI0025B59451|nr:3-hydroxyacyl-CoA dehydrogenase [Aquisalimonas lutea]MDN3516567.1 3-hydroxyacyl-CoA dehydrogenase [Aquisalimonas lutea]
MQPNIAVVGSGLIGRAWAIVFARAGFPVRLYDIDSGALDYARDRIAEALGDLARYGLIEDSDVILGRIRTVSDLAEALDDVAYVQECAPETVDAKRSVFAELDRAAADDVILASSSSGIVASDFIGHLQHPERCLIAHPVNPPYLIPLVELCPAPVTDPSVTERARSLLLEAGQVPVMVRGELRGFILNRIQGAVLNESLRLYEDGYVTVADIDDTLRHGLGLRWSFMGPFETIDLNAPGGLKEYADRYGPLYEALSHEQADPRPWSRETIERLHAERRSALPEKELEQRQSWRDKRLMALIAHKTAAAKDSGS